MSVLQKETNHPRTSNWQISKLLLLVAASIILSLLLVITKVNNVFAMIIIILFSILASEALEHCRLHKK